MSNDNQNQIASASIANVNISASAFAAKYRSKRECYNFLAVDCGIYLPAYGKCMKFACCYDPVEERAVIFIE